MNLSAKMEVFDIRRLVRNHFRGRQSAGEWSVAWDGKDEDQRRVGSGVYLVRLQYGARSELRKVTLLK